MSTIGILFLAVILSAIVGVFFAIDWWNRRKAKQLNP